MTRQVERDDRKHIRWANARAATWQAIIWYSLLNMARIMYSCGVFVSTHTCTLNGTRSTVALGGHQRLFLDI